jgi:hypothetical protein
MQKVMNWFTQKRMFWFGLIGFIGVIASYQDSVASPLYDSCMNWNLAWSGECLSTVGYFRMLLLAGGTALIPSIAIYFTKDTVFESWEKTFRIYLIVYLIICVFVPWDGGDAYLHFEKDLIGLSFSVCYVIYSIVYIIYRNLTLKN